MKRIAVIFAGGVGSRMKNDKMPKQFLEWNGKPILIQTLSIFEEEPFIDGIVLVCKSDWMDYAKALIAKEGLQKSYPLFLVARLHWTLNITVCLK